MGYSTGDFAPGRCSNHTSCLGGDSGTEPYIVTHHQLLAHAATVQLYKQKYQAHQNGGIGITLVSYWFLPYSNSTADQLATKRSFDFMLGWCVPHFFSSNLLFLTAFKSRKILVLCRIQCLLTSISSLIMTGSWIQ